MKLDSEEKVLDAARLAIDTLEQEAQIRQKMEAHGYTAEQVKEGKTLLTKALNVRHKKDACYDTQWELSQQIKAQLGAVQGQFREYAKVARTAYRNEPGTLHMLRIERMDQQGWACVRQAAYFYHKLQEKKLSLQAYGVSAKEIQQATAETTELLTLRQVRIRQKGMAESCTQEKQQAFRELRAWVMELRGIARIAFKSNPQLLEAFGMLVRSLV